MVPKNLRFRTLLHVIAAVLCGCAGQVARLELDSDQTADAELGTDLEDSSWAMDSSDDGDAVALADEADWGTAEETKLAPDVLDVWDTSDSGDCSMINLDFPCASEKVCMNEVSYAGFQTLNCEQAGYNPECCNGATCHPTSGGACPAGQLCHGFYGKPWVPACADPECAEKSDCEKGEFCLRPRGQCDSPGKVGVCALAQYTWTGGVNYEYGPFCGCDGKTYFNFLKVLEAQVSVDYKGKCCDPSKMPFAKENLAGFTQLEICGLPDWMSAGLGCNPQAVKKKCPDDWSCMIDLPAATSVTDAEWKSWCVAASTGAGAYGHSTKP